MSSKSSGFTTGQEIHFLLGRVLFCFEFLPYKLQRHVYFMHGGKGGGGKLDHAVLDTLMLTTSSFRLKIFICCWTKRIGLNLHRHKNMPACQFGFMSNSHHFLFLFPPPAQRRRGGFAHRERGRWWRNVESNTSFKRYMVGINAPRCWSAAQGQATREDTDCPMKGEVFACDKIPSSGLAVNLSMCNLLWWHSERVPFTQSC